MTMVEAVLKNTEGQLSHSASLLQQILAAAADERGEWQLPLAEDKLQGMRKVACIKRFVLGLTKAVWPQCFVLTADQWLRRLHL